MWPFRKFKPMGLEKECDKVLEMLDEISIGMVNLNSGFAKLILQKKGVQLSFNQRRAVYHILLSEDFVTTDEDENITLTSRGKAFIENDSFVKRAERLDVEYKTKKFLYKYRWLTWAISITALGVSLASYFKPSGKQVQILQVQSPKLQKIPSKLSLGSSNGVKPLSK